MASRKFWIYGFLTLVLVAAIATIVTLFLVFDDNDRKGNVEESDRIWGWKCIENQCKKVIIKSNANNTSSMSVCRLTCSDDIGTLLPKPMKISEMSKKVVPINIEAINYILSNNLHELIPRAWIRFMNMQRKKIQISQIPNNPGKRLEVNFAFIGTHDTTFTYETKEGYKLTVYEYSDRVVAGIYAENFYGARHALETLDQLIVFDDFNDQLVILHRVEIEDEPKFKHRGISVDTSRNFYSVENIKRTIEGLAMVKKNTFHWHITDSQSIPMEFKSRPELTKLGAYSPDKIYKVEDIKEIVRFAKVRGVRVIPEFDTPAHVGEGWQETGLVLCYKDPKYNGAQWRGHFDPTQNALYNYLEDIYRDIVDAFDPFLLHMGADEVRLDCWNSSTSIRNWMITNRGWNADESGFMNLWSYFQENAIQRLDKSLDKKIPIIVWTSSLTEEPYLSRLLDKNRYIVQVWTAGNDPDIRKLLENGFNVIMSNSDALYLDCGVGGWVNEGLNWCSPYKTWQTIYNNRMELIAGPYVDQVFGAEATIWSESIDDKVLDMRIWPRASALAERLWTNSNDHWRRVEPRILWNNKRLAEIGGLEPERFQLEWCFQNEGDCVSTI